MCIDLLLQTHNNYTHACISITNKNRDVVD